MESGQASQAASRASVRRTGSRAWLTLPWALGLNESRLQETAELFDQLAADASVESIVVGGGRELFLSGADLPLMVRSIVSGDIERVLRFTQSAHDWLARIERSSKPVVAWVEGAAFGAGVELALACHTIVASERAKFSLPETSLGIYPGMGGTQRLPRRIGVPLAKWMIYTGAIVPAAQAIDIGLIDTLSPDSLESASAVSASLAGQASGFKPQDGSLTTTGRRERPDFEPQTRFDILQRFFDEMSVAQLLDPDGIQVSEPELIRALIQIRNNGPIALRLVERLIDEGQHMSLDDAIQRELTELRQVFATEDALNGLLTFGKSRAKFVGR